MGAGMDGTESDLERRVAGYLDELTAYPDRHVGGAGNRAATAMFAERVAGFGFRVERTTFACLDWEFGDGVLEAGGERFALEVGPYSPPTDIVAPLVPVARVEELESESVRGAIVLLHGDIASGQVMPRNFRFYNPDSHKRILRALDTYGPAAVVAATGRDPSMVGSQYPFPLFEDGDLGHPSAYTTDVEGTRLLAHAGGPVRLVLDSARVSSTGEHVVARLAGDRPDRIVATAHIDSRHGSPGALDNASGVATLLALAELLGGRTGGYTVDLVPFNGEDNYANPGELMWIAENEGRFDEIVLGINVDDSGQRGAINHVSFYDCPPEVESAVRRVMEPCPRIDEGPQWFQGDHGIFGMYGRPAIAIASSEMVDFMARYAHTERDTVDLADPALIAETARFIADVIAASE